MRRSVFLLLISAIVLSAALALPANWKESGSESESEYNDYNELSEQQDLNSSIEKTISKRAAKDTSYSTEDDELTDGGSEDVNDKMDSSMESSWVGEHMLIMASEEEAESAVRRRRSGERNRNLSLLATICPYADFSQLENGITLNSRIEISDMYAICKTLPESGRAHAIQLSSD
ncbi:uncharacterized protein LOC6734295 [Drosophila simulans]|uniref:GD10958 n=1 Tax=Drosophila simulans TaxID=7240 RepID=B4QE15_DROSI|nr:uncharacterized protein LOC6734295 [Drosophila simulans]EDX06909.1 GD10958 [Drosophila simulans]KMY93464.1 uncharacterized protein Dsimw501_GD10958 [Drosophila simulans]